MQIFTVGAEGFLEDSLTAQANPKRPGEYLLPPDAITVEPEQKDGYWPKWNGNAWDYVKVPATAEEAVGMVVSHTSTSRYATAMRELVRRFSREDGYREKRGDDLSWAVEKIPEKTEEEKLQEAKEQARAKRDALLSACDYFVMVDYPASEEDKALVVLYRQALRDVPQQEGFPFDIVWPEKPEVL